VDKGLQLVFGVCSGLACVGLLLTWFFVDDKAHDSLTTVSDEIELEVAEVELVKAASHSKIVGGHNNHV